MPAWGSDSTLVSELSIAESLKATAEAVLWKQSAEASDVGANRECDQWNQQSQTGTEETSSSEYVYDASSGFYYHPASGYYWDPSSELFYDYSSGTYYQYDESSGEYRVHSQVPASTNTQESNSSGNQVAASEDKCLEEKELDLKGVRSKRRRVKKRSKTSEKEKGVVSRSTKQKAKLIDESSTSTDRDKNVEKDQHRRKDEATSKGDRVEIIPSSDEEGAVSISDSSSDSLATGESEMLSDPKSGELSSTESSDVEMVAIESAPQIYEGGAETTARKSAPQHLADEMAENHPPCIRVIVLESDSLIEGSLHMVTCAGGVIGRLKSSRTVLEIPDINVSKEHAQIDYDHDNNHYRISDLGSQNGTMLNGSRIVQTEDGSGQVLSHGDILKFCKTKLLLHIHKGLETCDECEPGQVQAKLLAAKQIFNDHVILSKAEKNQQRRQKLKQIKKKYGLQNSKFDHSGSELNKDVYADKAFLRRKYIGSEMDVGGTSQPASVHRPITTANKGHKLLSKMGWKEGEGLGRDNSGISEPINVELRVNQSAGLGSSQGVSLSLDNVHDTNKAKRWSQAKQRYQQLAASDSGDGAARTPAGVINESTPSSLSSRQPTSHQLVDKQTSRLISSSSGDSGSAVCSVPAIASPQVELRSPQNVQSAKSSTPRISWVRGEVQQNSNPVPSTDSNQTSSAPEASGDNT